MDDERVQLSWGQFAAILAIVGVLLAVVYETSQSVVGFGAGIGFAAICFAVPILLRLRARKDEFIAKFDEMEKPADANAPAPPIDEAIRRG